MKQRCRLSGTALTSAPGYWRRLSLNYSGMTHGQEVAFMSGMFQIRLSRLRRDAGESEYPLLTAPSECIRLLFQTA
jgi:hypothetical protein